MPVPSEVLLIGPPPDLPGGMSTVMRQMAHMDFGSRYRVCPFPITLSRNESEAKIRSVIRHVRHRLLLGRLLRAKPAICHIHTCSGFSFHRSGWDLKVAKRHGCRTVLHMHGAQFDEYFAQAGGWERWRIRHTLESADRVVALSENWKKKLQCMAPAASIALIENAVEKPLASYQRRTSPRCRFLMLCRMDTWKGVDDLLDACAMLRRQGIPFEVTLAGPGGSAGDQRGIEKKIRAKDLSEHVVYIGPVDAELRALRFAETDVLLQPSHHEGMPIAILEAFAHGLPVIATRVGAVPEIMVPGEHGLLVEPRQPASLAAAMSMMTVDPPKRRSMGLSAAHLAETRFSIHRFREDLLALYDGLLCHGARHESRASAVKPPADPRATEVRPFATAP